MKLNVKYITHTDGRSTAQSREEWRRQSERHIDLATMNDFIPPLDMLQEDRRTQEWKRNYVLWLMRNDRIRATRQFASVDKIIRVYEDHERCAVLVQVAESFPPRARYANLQTEKHLRCLSGKHWSEGETRIPGIMTLTFGEQAEGHHGMNILGGGRYEIGLTYEELMRTREVAERLGGTTELYDLSTFAPADLQGEHTQNAYLFIFRNGIEYISDYTSYEIAEEQYSQDWDRKAWMRGRVVNKRARFNLVYGDRQVDPEYAKKESRIVAWDSIPKTQSLRNNLSEFFGPKAQALKGEGNFYYEPSVCGIGYHGDSERRVVIAARMGESAPIHFQWYMNGLPVGPNKKFALHDGDVYAMSDKTTGHDWKRRLVPTLRHATGCKKYTTIASK